VILLAEVKELAPRTENWSRRRVDVARRMHGRRR